ncbi:MAG: hypothetical protein C4297_02275 [Gemmataceae bacterium]
MMYEEHPINPYESARQDGLGIFGRFLVTLVLLFVLSMVGLYLAPTIRERWNESDPYFLLQKRALEAQAEAEAWYRRRQAELKAEAEAAAQRLERLEIPASPFRDAVRKALPSVVGIQVELRSERVNRRWPVAPPDMAPTRAEGSGVIIGRDRDTVFILTNSHLVQDATAIRIHLASGLTLPADKRQIADDPTSDLALVRVEIPQMPHLVEAEWGDSDAVQPGDWVVAIGSPFGLDHSVSVGVVSARGRAQLGIGTLDNIELIQTDAAMNPGNSGGPLLDLRGRVIGINTAIFTRSGAHQGVGFAIPAKTARTIAAQLQKEGKVVRGFLGVQMVDAAETGRAPSGVLITYTQPGCPAAEAGIQPGDIVVRFDGRDVLNAAELRRLVMETRPGLTVKVEVLRNRQGKSEHLTFDVTLIQRPPLFDREQRRP